MDHTEFGLMILNFICALFILTSFNSIFYIILAIMNVTIGVILLYDIHKER